MKVGKYQSESHLQCPKPEGWACKKPKNLKMIDSANKLSGCFDRRRRCSRSTLRWGKAPRAITEAVCAQGSELSKYCHLKKINDNLKVLNTLYN